MKQIIILLLILAFNVFPATRTWSGAANSDMNDTANYDGAGALLTTDDLLFNTGAVAATASGNLDVNSITITSGYSGTWSMAGYTITTNGDAGGFALTIDGTGVHTLAAMIINGNNATAHFGSGSSFSGTSRSITWNGTGGTIDNDKTMTMVSLSVGANAGVTIEGDAQITYASAGVVLTVGDSSTLTVNARNNFQRLDAGPLFSLPATYTFNGTAEQRWYADGYTVTLPEINYTGTGLTYIQSTKSGGAFTLTDDLSVYRIASLPGGSYDMTLTDGGYSITTASDFTCGSTLAGGTFVGNFTGTHTIGGNFVPYDVGTITINLQTSTWNVAGNVTLWSTATIDRGTSHFNINGACTFTSNGRQIYDITTAVNSPNSFTTADDLSCNSFTSEGTSTGNINFTGDLVTCSGDMILQHGGLTTMGTGVTMTGNNATLRFSGGLGSVSATSCVLTWQGTGQVFDDDKLVTIKAWVQGANSTVTNSGAQSTNIQGNTTLITLGDSSTLTTTQAFILYPTADMDLYSLGSGYTWNGGQIFNANGTGGGTPITVNLPAFTYTGIGSPVLSRNTSSVIFRMTGDLIFPTAGIITVNNSHATYTVEFDCNGYNITCGMFRPGATGAAANIIKFGSGTHNIGSFYGLTYNGASSPSIDSLQTATINCSGNWSNGSYHTVVPGTSTVNFTGTAANTITSNNKSFNNVVINKTVSGSITLGDSLQCSDLTITDGKFIIAENIRVSGNVDFNSDDSLLCKTASKNLVLTSGSTKLFIDSTVLKGIDSLNIIAQGSDSLFVEKRANVRTLQFTPGKSYWFSPGDTIGVAVADSSHWNGTSGSRVALRSKTPGTQFYTVIDSFTVSYMNPTDSYIVGGVITASDGTSLNGGNNTNWDFPLSGRRRTRFGYGFGY